MANLKGLDTTFLVQVEVSEAPLHKEARKILEKTIEEGVHLSLAPQVLSEFIHIVTDPKRFSSPLTVEKATQRAEQWWIAKEVVPATPTRESVLLTLRWLQEYNLGRKRILDTQLAATYYAHEVTTILSSNKRDFAIFDLFEIESP